MSGKLTIVVLIVILIGFQLIPVDRSNPAGGDPFDGPVDIAEVLERACYDCHSNETEWPWYSYVAPISWMVARDVHSARGELNFSTWGRLQDRKKAKMISDIWDEVEAGQMPPPIYRFSHRDTKLSDDELELFKAWAVREGSQ